MSFWTDITLREPLRQNRWYILFGNDLLNPYIYALKECSKPEYSIETSSHVLLNHTFNFPKNLVWKPINVKMVSARGDNNSLPAIIDFILRQFGYRRPDDGDQAFQISKSRSALAIEIVQVDANGIPIEKWSLSNTFITNVNYGSLSYNSEEFVDTSFTISYDYANLTTLNGSGSITMRAKEIKDGKIDKVDATYGNITEEKTNEKIEQLKKLGRIVHGTIGFPVENE